MEKSYEEFVNVPSDAAAGGGVGTASLGTEEVHLAGGEDQPGLLPVKTFPVQAGGKGRWCGNDGLPGLDDLDQIGRKLCQRPAE